jgi:radical SAM protein with 4Fe4S-binding SPASM domain
MGKSRTLPPERGSKMRISIKYLLEKILGERRYQKLRSLYWILASKLHDDLDYITVDISGMCNINCVMCALKGQFDQKGMMSFETFKKLENVLRRVNAISLSCNCEPLMNKDIIKMIDLCISTNKNIKVLFSTNGTLLTPDLISRLVGTGLDRIFISIDSADSKTFEQIRNGAQFENVIKNVRELVAQRNARKDSAMKICVRTVASDFNIHELPAILDLVRELGVDSFSVVGLEPYFKELADKILYSKHNEKPKNKCEEVFSVLRRKASEDKMEISLPSLQAVPYCSCRLQNCVISWNGDVSPCSSLSYQRPYWYFGENSMYPKITFGNINNNDLYDIWNSEKFKKFRTDLLGNRLPEYCKKCLHQHRVLSA